MKDIFTKTENNEVDYLTGKKNILVTGGAGFIGSHLCDELIKKNHVLCIDNYLTGAESNIDHLLQNPNFGFIKHDLTESIDLEQTREGKKIKIKFQGLEEIYHCACPTSPKEYNKYPIETLLANAYATKNVLDLAVKYKAKLLFLSSDAIYGEPHGQDAFAEDYWGFIDPIGPRSCYNEGKRFAESLVVNYGQKYGIKTKIVRVFNTYGPRMKLDDGRLIPDLVNQALTNEPLIIYHQPDETTSLCFIEELISGLIKMMHSSEPGPINLGSEQSISFKEVGEMVIRLTNSKSKMKFEKPLPYTAKQGLPNITLAKQKLEWFPLVDLEKGLKMTIEKMTIEKRRVSSF